MDGNGDLGLRAFKLPLALALASFGLASVAGAQLQLPLRPLAPDDAGVLIVVPGLDLGSVSLMEMFGLASGLVDRGTHGTADITGGLLGTGVILRTAPVWQMWIKKNDLNQMVVQYDLRDFRNRRNRLCHVTRRRSQIPTVINPLPLQELDRQGAWRLMEGSITLSMDLNSVVFSGSHGGTLTVEINNL